MEPRKPNRVALFIGIAVLFLLHQDCWYWDDPTLVLGIFPIGLFYHMMYTVAAAAFWFAAMQFAWPTDIEAMAEEGAPEA